MLVFIHEVTILNREEFLKELIMNKYGSVKSFAEHIDIPYTTIRSILERGVGKAGVDTVIKICQGLGIKPEQLVSEFNSDEYIAKTLSTMYSLNKSRQQQVYSFAEKQLEEQNKVVDFPSIDDTGTLAAHSADPNKTFDDNEIDKINLYLDKLDEDYDSKHKK